MKFKNNSKSQKKNTKKFMQQIKICCKIKKFKKLTLKVINYHNSK